MLGQATGDLGLTRFTTAQTWGKSPPSPFSILYASPRGPHPNGFLSRDSYMRVPKFSKLGLLRFRGPITLCVNLRSGRCWKKSYSLHRKLSNSMSHATYTQGNRVDSRLLVVASQTTNLTPILSFGHNLCFRCPNGSCEPILNIYVSLVFQWYKKIFDAMGFDPCNYSMKIWESIGTPTPKMGAQLGLWVSIVTFSHILGLPLGPRPCKPLPWSRAQG
jgi:hypothetical protein